MINELPGRSPVRRVVRVALPGGRVRELRVLRVVPAPSDDPAAERAA